MSGEPMAKLSLLVCGSSETLARIEALLKPAIQDDARDLELGRLVRVHLAGGWRLNATQRESSNPAQPRS